MHTEDIKIIKEHEMKCLICNEKERLNFFDNYKLEVKTDQKYFDNLKIYNCKNCDFSFVHPMPDENKLNYFYKNVYRSLNRPHFMGLDKEEIKKFYLQDKNLNYLLYLTTFLNFNNINSVFDFGAGIGDLGYLLKKNFPHLKLYCSESDEYSKKILEDRGYINYENLDHVDKKFDLIISLHSLEHLTNIETIFKFPKLLNNNGFLFFEVPNCPTKTYYINRPYDCPHLLFFTEKSIEIISEKMSLRFINFSSSSYSYEDDFKFQKESKNIYHNWESSNLNYLNLKTYLKKITPKFILKLRRNLIKYKTLNDEKRYKWFVNNSNDNCYLRGILTNSTKENI